MTAPRGLPTLVRTTVQLPVKGAAAHWSYGTAVLARPGTTEVLLTLPSAAARTPWARLDVADRAVHVGTSMPGPLRAAYFPETEADPRWWVLGLHGVVRVDPDDPATVHDVVRQGIGRYPRRMFGLGRSHLAVGTDLSGNVVLLSKESGRPVGRLRLPWAGTSVVVDDALVRVFAPRQGTAYDVDPVRLKVVRRHRIPAGKGERLVGDVLHYLAGDVTEVPIVSASTPPTPGVPVVIGDGVGGTAGTTLVARELLGVDVRTLEVSGPGGHALAVVPTAVEVLGIDAQGCLAVGTPDGFALVDPGSGALLAEHVEPRGIVGAGMVPGRNAVVLATSSAPLGTVALLTW
jgi:hypothetical protein